MAFAAEPNPDDLNQRLRSMILSNIQLKESHGHQRAEQEEQRIQPSFRGHPIQVNERNASAPLNQVSPHPANAHHGPRQVKSTHKSPNQASRKTGGYQGHFSSDQAADRAQSRNVPHSNDYRRAPPRSRPNKFTPLSKSGVSSGDEINAQAAFLETLAGEVLPAVEMGAEEWATKDAFREYLLNICIKALEPSSLRPCSLECFGSFASGFGTPGSDMDLAFVISDMDPQMPRILEQAFLEAGMGARLLTKTRVPILKICERPSKELYNALCAERQKWDNMTPEEREKNDMPSRQSAKNPKGEQEADNNINGREQSQISEGIAQSSAPTSTHPASEKAREGTREKGFKSGQGGGLLSTERGIADDVVSPVYSENAHDAGHGNSKQTKTGLPSSEKGAKQNVNSRQPRREKQWFRERALGPLDFPKDSSGGIQCDINFAAELGLHNTHLLRCYAACDVRVRLMVLFIKHWASRRKINSSYNGTLSSYGYVLMILHYLVNVVSPPVCPNLQLSAKRPTMSANGYPNPPLPPNPNHPYEVCEGWDVRFWRNEAEIRDLSSRGLMTHNHWPLGTLLRGFFHYYALQQRGGSVASGFGWTHQVLSLRTPGGLLSKEEKGWTGAKTTLHDEKEIRHRYLMAVEDPFELDHNVARTVTHHGICAIRDEMRRAWRILVQVGTGQVPEGNLLDLVVDVKPIKDLPPEGNTPTESVPAALEETRAADDDAHLHGRKAESGQELGAPGGGDSMDEIALPSGA